MFPVTKCSLHYCVVCSCSYDLQCDLVEVAEQIKRKHELTEVSFICEDALNALHDSLVTAAIVYLDNDAWEMDISEQIYQKLSERVRPGTVVIGWHNPRKFRGFANQGWSRVKRLRLEASWTSVVSVVAKLKPGERYDGYDHLARGTQGKLGSDLFSLAQRGAVQTGDADLDVGAIGYQLKYVRQPQQISSMRVKIKGKQEHATFAAHVLPMLKFTKDGATKASSTGELVKDEV